MPNVQFTVVPIKTPSGIPQYGVARIDLSGARPLIRVVPHSSPRIDTARRLAAKLAARELAHCD